MQLKLKRWSSVAFSSEEVRESQTLPGRTVHRIVERNRKLFRFKLGVDFEDRHAFHDALQQIVEQGSPSVADIVQSFSDVRRNGLPGDGS